MRVFGVPPAGALGFVLALGLVGSAAAQVRIDHVPAATATAGAALDIEASVAGPVSPELLGTADVVVLSAGSPVYVPLVLSGGVLSGRIPGELVSEPELVYYVRVTAVEGQLTTLPPGAERGAAFVVPVFGALPALPRAVDPVEILSPLPDAVVADRRPVVAGLLDPPLDDSASFIVLLDGADVTSGADVGRDYFVLEPADSLADGKHTVVFSALTAAGRVEAEWWFFVRTRAADDWLAAEAERGAPMAPYGGEVDIARDLPGTSVYGRFEVGWVSVEAETVAVESVSVFLPYGEISRPTLDAYAAGHRGGASFLLSAQYDPLYDEDLAWSASASNERLDAQVGDVYPALSGTTLDWAVGQGALLGLNAGNMRTELVAMRMSEADTAGGFGVYSRFALAGSERLTWGGGSSVGFVVLHAFDREGSVPDDQQLSEPLRNTVIAGVAEFRSGRRTVGLELGRSTLSGDLEGAGVAFRAKVAYEVDPSNRASVEFISSEPSFYSAGSFEHEPGKSGVETELLVSPGPRLQLTGTAGAFRTESSTQGVKDDELEFRFYSRADLTLDAPGGNVRTYAAARYDRVPYESYDYVYVYGSGGASYRARRLVASVSGSWSRTDAGDARDTWTAAGDVRWKVLPGTWELRLAGRLAAGSSDDGETEYTRATWSAETTWTLSGVEMSGSYEVLDRDDRSEPGENYTEHVVRVSVGRAF